MDNNSYKKYRKYRKYTAVGRYDLKRNRRGMLQPVVTVNNEEKEVSIDEMILWSILMWDIKWGVKVKTVYTYTSENAGRDPKNFEKILKRLIARGLIVCSDGEREDIAIFNLIKDLKVVPIRSSMGAKMWTFINMVFKEHLSIANAWDVFGKEEYSDMAKRVLQITKKESKSVTDILKVIAPDTEFYDYSAWVDRKPNDRLGVISLAEMISYPWMCEVHREAMEAIWELYYNRNIIFDKSI